MAHYYDYCHYHFYYYYLRKNFIICDQFKRFNE